MQSLTLNIAVNETSPCSYNFVNVDCWFFKAETTFFTHLSVSTVTDQYCCPLSCPPKCSFSTSATASPPLEQHQADHPVTESALAFNVPKSEKSGGDEQNVLHKTNKNYLQKSAPPNQQNMGFMFGLTQFQGNI